MPGNSRTVPPKVHDNRFVGRSRIGLQSPRVRGKESLDPPLGTHTKVKWAAPIRRDPQSADRDTDENPLSARLGPPVERLE